MENERLQLSTEQRQQMLNGVGWTPERAREMLEDLGYEESDWKGRSGRTIFHSHELTAYAVIAEGAETRLPGEVYMEVREREGLSRIRELPPLQAYQHLFD